MALISNFISWLNEFINCIREFLKTDEPISVNINFLDDVLPFFIVFFLIFLAVYGALCTDYTCTTSWSLYRLKISFSICRQGISELSQVNVSITVCVKSFEGDGYIFLGHHFLMIDCSSEKFLEIDFAITIKITRFEHLFPFVIAITKMLSKQSTCLFDLIETQMTVFVRINLSKSLFEDF